MNPRPCSDVSAYDLFGMTQIWHVFLCNALPREPDYVIAGKNEVHHLDAGRGQKTLQFFRFGDYLSHIPIVPLRQLSPHRVETEFGQNPFRGVKLVTLPIQSHAFAMPGQFYITILVLGASNPAGITASFGFQFQERINVVREMYSIACFGVVLGHLILVDLMDLEYLISFLHGQPNFIHYPGAREGAILILGMRAFLTRSVTASSKQAEHEFIITTVGEDGMVNLSGGTIEHLIRPSTLKHASMSLHASPT